MTKESLGCLTGTAVSATGTAMQTNEVLQTISLILTIIGSIVTMAVAISSWWKKAKEDGKIDKDELQEGADIIINGVSTIENSIKEKEDNK